MSNDIKHALPEYTLLREYKIERVLGAGGFGITYLAEDTHLKRQVAIKEYFPGELAWREETTKVLPRTGKFEEPFVKGVESFLSEAQKLAKFTHPNIVTIHNFFPANGTAYFVMPYYDGESLGDYLERIKRPLSEEEVREFIVPILTGMEAIHTEGILHRDIKPENIYLPKGREPLLIDFGAARVAVGQASRSLTMVLTPGYAPIEQYNEEGKKQGAWSDLYGLGAVMYHCITEKEPPPAPDRLGEIYGEEDPYKPAVEVGKGKYSEDFLKAIDLSLHPKPLPPRPQSVEEFRKLLKEPEKKPEVVTKTEVPKSPSKPIPVQKTSPAWKAGAIVFAILTFLLAVAIANLTDDYNRMERYYNSERIENRQIKSELDQKKAENSELLGKVEELEKFKEGIIKNRLLVPLKIKSVEFANGDSESNIINSFGSTLYRNQLRYLKPRIKFDSFLDYGKDFKIHVKMYRPNGVLDQGSSSPSGYTFSDEIYLKSNSRNQTARLKGWGTKEPGSYSIGTYRFEIWYEGLCLKSVTVDVK